MGIMVKQHNVLVNTWTLKVLHTDIFWLRFWSVCYSERQGSCPRSGALRMISLWGMAAPCNDLEQISKAVCNLAKVFCWFFLTLWNSYWFERDPLSGHLIVTDLLRSVLIFSFQSRDMRLGGIFSIIRDNSLLLQTITLDKRSLKTHLAFS